MLAEWALRARVEAADRTLQVGAIAGLAQGEEPRQPGDGAASRGELVKKIEPRQKTGL
jgi:hypothetical protein